MFDVYVTNGLLSQVIHDHRPAAQNKLPGGTISEGVNTIESFTFDILPNNAGYDMLHPFTSMVSVYNTKKSAHAFIGRVLQITPIKLVQHNEHIHTLPH